MSKRVLITGANRGLGLVLARQAAQSGWEVIAGMRQVPQDGPFHELQAAHSDQLEAVELDVAREETIAALAAQLRASGRKLDAIVNNAGVLIGRGEALEELNMDGVDATFDVNLFGPIRVAKHLLPLMNDGPDSVVLNISSEAGSTSNAYGGDYAYALSKSALNMFSRQLRAHVKGRDIRVYAVHPGWIRTDMGGDNAPGDPEDSAAGLLRMLESPEAAGEAVFVDTKGRPMPD